MPWIPEWAHHNQIRRCWVSYARFSLKGGCAEDELRVGQVSDPLCIGWGSLPLLHLPRCGRLMRNRAWLQPLIKASSGNRPLAGCSFLSLTSCYFVFPPHHLHHHPLLPGPPSLHLSLTPLLVFSGLFLRIPSSSVNRSGNIGDVRFVADSEATGGLRDRTAH